MSREKDDAERIVALVIDAFRRRSPLVVQGAGSKAFLGAPAEGDLLSLADHVGVIDYRPDELVVTARAGTPLVELERTLAEAGQMLPFEPPTFGGNGTLGGAVATGLSGPGRPWYGSVRDAVLGVEVVTGAGRRMRFGGQVMKNVAGYDLSRLMTGAFGTLGVLLSVSVRVRPRPDAEITRSLTLDRDAALASVLAWDRRAEPVTATRHVDGRLSVRLSGDDGAIRKAAARLGGDGEAAAGFWRDVRDQRDGFFRGATVWRLALPCAARHPEIEGDWLTEWGGAQRWLATSAEAPRVEEAARRAGGHAAVFRGAGATPRPACEGAEKYRMRLKEAFDPAGILNRARSL